MGLMSWRWLLPGAQPPFSRLWARKVLRAGCDPGPWGEERPPHRHPNPRCCGSRAGRSRGFAASCAAEASGGGCGTGRRFAEIHILWATAESRAGGCELTGCSRDEKSTGWSCLGPTAAPGPPPPGPTRPPVPPCIEAGTPGAFPGLPSLPGSCRAVPSFLLPRCSRAPLAVFALIHVCSWQQTGTYAKQNAVPFPRGGGRRFQSAFGGS